MRLLYLCESKSNKWCHCPSSWGSIIITLKKGVSVSDHSNTGWTDTTSSPFCPPKNIYYLLCNFYYLDCEWLQSSLRMKWLKDYHQLLLQMSDAKKVCCKPEVRFLIQGVLSQKNANRRHRNENQMLAHKQKPNFVWVPWGFWFLFHAGFKELKVHMTPVE